LFQGVPGLFWLCTIAALRSRASSKSSNRARRVETSRLRLCSVGFRVGFFFLIAVGIFSIFHEVNHDQVFFQSEQHPIDAHPQTVPPRLTGQFLNVALQISLQGFQFLTDALPLFPG